MGCAASSAGIAKSVAFAPTHFFDEYALGKKLGRGAFAQVRIAAQVTPGGMGKSVVAVKILDLRDQKEPDKTNGSRQKRACEEAAIWASVSHHKNIVQLHRVFFDETFFYLVMERCSGSLFHLLASLSELNERTLGNILVQMFVAISHVHSLGVVHRDVKPDNFLAGGQHGTVVKLCDFGLSATLPKVAMGLVGKLKGGYGSMPFMCPEMLNNEHYDERADVWSMAVVAYCLLFGGFLYGSEVIDAKEMKQAIVDGKPPSFEPAAPCFGQVRSESAVEFVQTVLERRPDQRQSASDALRMPFMVAVNQDQHMKGVDLPSLRPMLYAARKAGVFHICNLAKKTDIDVLLNEKQKTKYGWQLPDQTDLAKNREPQKRSESGNRQLAKRWQAAQSGTSSFATTASKNVSSQGTFSPHGSSPRSPIGFWMQ